MCKNKKEEKSVQSFREFNAVLDRSDSLRSNQKLDRST